MGRYGLGANECDARILSERAGREETLTGEGRGACGRALTRREILNERGKERAGERGRGGESILDGASGDGIEVAAGSDV